MTMHRAAFIILACLTTLISPYVASAAMSNPVTYRGNGGAGGVVANGSLTLKDDGTTVYGTFTKTPGISFQFNLVFYIDSVSGGFANTSAFSDSGSLSRSGASGFDRSSNKRATATFAPGFTADYAIVLGVNPPLSGGNDVFRLAAGNDGSFVRIASALLNPSADLNSPTYTFQFTWADIGISKTDPHFFRFQSTYVSSTGTRTLESFESLTGPASSVTFSNYNTYGVGPVPEMATTALVLFGGLFALTRLPKPIGWILRKRPRRGHDGPAIL